MKIQKKFLIGLCAGALMCGTTAAFAAPPPPPPGVVLVPGMAWCPRCGGCGHVSSGFFGMHQKRCPDCEGRGMYLPKHHHHAAPQPPPQPAPRRMAPPTKRGPQPHHPGPGPR